MSTDPKSLAAEIEAVLMEQLTVWTTNGVPIISGIPAAAAEIAALQSRAFEDGARWMRERAAETAKHRYSPLELDQLNFNGQKARNSRGHDRFMSLEEADRHVSGRVSAILAIPLQPEGERSDG